MKKIISKIVFTLLASIAIIGCSKDDSVITETDVEEVSKSSAKEILSFVFTTDDNSGLNESVTATINESDKVIRATFPFGTDITNLIPTIKTSESASVSPEGSQDFSSAITYTVTAEDGSEAEYMVTVSKEVSSEKQITNFVFTTTDNANLSNDVIATVNETDKTITVDVSFDTDITILIPVIEISDSATITPIEVQDFTNPVIYTVTAANESTVDYTVTVIKDTSAFVTTWQTTIANESITIFINDETTSSGFGVTTPYDYQVNWGDGTIETGFTANATHIYETAGVYMVQISGDFTAINNRGESSNAAKLLTIENWGDDIVWESMYGAFNSCTNLTNNTTSIPNLSNVTSMEFMFINATLFDGDLNSWDVSTITNMDHVFESATSFNGNISNWDVSNVTTMEDMFQYAESFNGNISSWNVSEVTDMGEMFNEATIFSQDLSGWATDKVTDCVSFSLDSGLTAAQLPTAGSCF